MPLVYETLSSWRILRWIRHTRGQCYNMLWCVRKVKFSCCLFLLWNLVTLIRPARNNNPVLKRSAYLSGIDSLFYFLSELFSVWTSRKCLQSNTDYTLNFSHSFCNMPICGRAKTIRLCKERIFNSVWLSLWWLAVMYVIICIDLEHRMQKTFTFICGWWWIYV